MFNPRILKTYIASESSFVSSHHHIRHVITSSSWMDITEVLQHLLCGPWVTSLEAYMPMAIQLFECARLIIFMAHQLTSAHW